MENGTKNHRKQIYKYATNKQILSITDLLNGEDEKKSKVVITLVKYDSQTKKALETVSHYLNPDDAKVVSWEILTSVLGEFKDYKGSKKDNGHQARILTIRKDMENNRGYILIFDQGEGKPSPQGAVMMTKKEINQWIALPTFEMKKLALSALDYLRAWEIKEVLGSE